MLALLDEVAQGEEIEITRYGRAVARLVAASGPNVLKGRFAGAAQTIGEDEDVFTTGATWDLP